VTVVEVRQASSTECRHDGDEHWRDEQRGQQVAHWQSSDLQQTQPDSEQQQSAGRGDGVEIGRWQHVADEYPDDSKGALELWRDLYRRGVIRDRVLRAFARSS